MENFIGLVYSTLEEKGINTAELSLEEALVKYNELENVEEVTVEDVAEEVDNTIEAENEPIEEETEEVEPITPTEEEVADIDVILEENQDIIDTLTDEQYELLNKIVALIK